MSWHGEEGPAGHPGVCMVAGSQLGGTLQELEEEGGHRDAGFTHTGQCKSPLPWQSWLSGLGI